MSTEVVDHIDTNFSTLDHQMTSTSRCTTFAYDLYHVESRYYNKCIRASVTTCINDPGALIPSSFSLLRDKLTGGRYVGLSLPASLQSIINLPIGVIISRHTTLLIKSLPEPPPPAPIIPGRGPGNGGTRNSGCEGDPVIFRQLPKYFRASALVRMTLNPRSVRSRISFWTKWTVSLARTDL